MRLQPIAVVKRKIEAYTDHPPQDDSDIRWMLNDIGHSFQRWLRHKRKWMEWGEGLTEDDYTFIGSFRRLIHATVIGTTYDHDAQIIESCINTTLTKQSRLEDSRSIFAMQDMIVSTRWVDIDEEFSIK